MPGFLFLPSRPADRRNSRLASTATAALLVALTLLLPLRAAAGDEEPRPLSAGERAAIELALDYLAEGAEAWLGRLHPDSPLAALDAEAARDEIAVRAGPPADAAWQLETPGPGAPEGRAIFAIDFPSGATETLVVDLRRTSDGKWALLRLHCLVEPWTESPYRLQEDDAPAGGAETAALAASPASAPPPHGPAPTASLLFAAAFALLTGAIALRGRRQHLVFTAAPRRAVVAIPVALTLLGCLLVACAVGGSGDPAADAPAADAPGTAAPGEAPMPRLAALWPLRRAVTLGRDRAQIDALLKTVPNRDQLRLAARLWLAELSLNQTDLSEAEAVLEALPQPSPLPLGDLLRARLAFVRLRPEDAETAYDRAIRSGPDHDGIRLEAADALNTLGLSLDAEIGYDLLAEMGSRRAEVYYGKAQYAVLEGKEDLGETYLRRAWHLRPLERSDLLSSPLLARLLARPGLFPLFELGSATEPAVDPPDAESHPLSPPRGTRSRLTGGLLRLEVAGASLEVPGGWAVAPHATWREGADALRRDEEERILAGLPGLMGEVREVGALANPRRRAEVEESALALARRNRWQELVQLTDGLDGDSLGPVPGSVVQLRAVALDRLHRTEEAEGLLIRLAKSDLANRRRDPASLYQLAELMAASGDYEVAVQLIRKASALSPLVANGQRIEQLRLQERLADDSGMWTTPRFRIVFPRITGEKYARQLGYVLEEEYERLRRWIPLPRDGGGDPIEVHLYPLLDFLRAYSGGALVLGIYDGVVRVPLADLRSLHPELVSILSHELAHAMIGRYTDERAPKWLHEGLAEHVQMTQDWINPVPDLAVTGRLIAFPVVEPILRGFAEPQLIELAYGQSAWTLHYVEATHGVAAVHELLAAFRDGANGEEAIRQVFGVSLTDFDADVRRWCLDEAPAAWPTKVRRYDHEVDLPFERSRERTGTAPSTAAPSREQAEAATRRALRSRMEAWHAAYTRRVTPFKQEIGKVLGDVSKGRVREHRLTCSLLYDRATQLLGSGDLFVSPDPAAGAALRRVFERFQEMSDACARGQGQAAQRSYHDAERELTEAARTLQPYGLAP